MRLAAMAQLIASSCPTYPLLGPTDRIAAAGDRLDVMLFTMMTLSPALPNFHDSLERQAKGRTRPGDPPIQARRPGRRRTMNCLDTP